MAALSIPLTLRNVKGSQLTFEEGDANFTGLRSAIQQITFFTPAMFEILGNGTNELTKIQNMLNAAAGGIIVCPTGLNFGFTGQLTIQAGTTIITNGSIFTRLTASTTHGFVIQSNVTIDRLVIFTPGGGGGDRSILITGGNFECDRISIRATADGNFVSTNWAVEIDGGGATFLSNIKIKSFRTVNFKTSLFVKRVEGLEVSDIVIDSFRVCLYFIDCRNVHVKNGIIRGLSPTLTGDAGENGVLIEGTANNVSSNINISNLIVQDSGEHAYRVGGQYTVTDIFFNDCVAIRPGRAGYVDYPSATQWSGGSGFKVLGGTTAINRRHKNVHLTNCTVIDGDINTSFGRGHGINNFTAFHVFCCDDVFITNCKVKNSGAQAYSAIQALILGASNNVHVTAFDCDPTDRSAFRPHDEAPGFAGLEFGIVGLFINGATFRSKVDNVTVCYMDGAKYAHSDWKMRGVNLYGGRTAWRFESATTGSYPTDAELDMTYQGSDSDEATVTTSLFTGVQVLRTKITAPWRVSAASPSLKDGSVYTDTITGNIRIRKSGVWNVL